MARGRPRWRLGSRKGSVAFVVGERIEGTAKSGRSGIVSIDSGTVGVVKARQKCQFADKLSAGEL
ncbi:hypothetical protein [Actinomadura fibrosa]|uniref:DUF397 domain-containing protein n=1 Tax=Actinomadura fibrosa TaxID=111802 RepID=A0ABW2XZX0_9ACTN|nr:hypothetical protein [Actinomadura fibrosa]